MGISQRACAHFSIASGNFEYCRAKELPAQSASDRKDQQEAVALLEGL
jgi:hypothetical protein